MIVNQLKIEIPDVFLSKALNRATFENVLDSTKGVQERLFMLANNVKEKYIWAELKEEVKGYALTATLNPKYVLTGEAKEQAQVLNIFNNTPLYTVQLELIDMVENESLVFVHSFLSTRDEVVTCILENLKVLENINIEERV